MIPKTLRIVVSGGAGGTGKSVISRNLGLFFASLGNRVFLLDFSSDFASILSFSGISGWKLVEQKGIFIQKTDMENFASFHAPHHSNKLVEIFREGEFGGKRFDVCIVDLPSGREGTITGLVELSDVTLLVTTPVPEIIIRQIEYASKIVLQRAVKESGRKFSMQDITGKWENFGGLSFFPCPRDFYDMESEGEIWGAIHKVLEGFRIGVVLNCMVDHKDVEYGWQMEVFARRVFGLPVTIVGGVEWDKEVIFATRNGRGVISSETRTGASLDLEKLGRRFLSFPDLSTNEPEWNSVFKCEDNYYEVLQCSFASPGYEIKANFEKLTKFFGKKNFLTRMVLKPDVILQNLEHFKRAYSVLSDSGLKEKYDADLISKISKPAYDDDKPLFEISKEEMHKRRVSSPIGNITGKFLKEVRENLGLTLQDVTSITKIGLKYLRAIEEENYVELPELVFLKGYLKEIARLLDLDPDKVSSSYIKRMKEDKT